VEKSESRGIERIMPRFDENNLAEDYFIRELQANGWKFIQAENLERESLEEPLLTPNLIRALRKLNPSITSDSEISQVLNGLRFKTSGAEGAKQVLNYLRDGVPVKLEKERVVQYLRLFDCDNIENNEFIVSRQVIHQAANNQIRNDILLYVNGIPLVNIECKNPANPTESWYNAYLQIKSYANMIPELYKYVQIGVAAEQTARYFAITPWPQEEIKLHEWREPSKDSIDSTIQMLKPASLLNIIGNYIFFRIEHGTTTKVIARYMQYRAAERICNRVLDYIQGKDTKNKGLIWHWQGSGKTLTMVFAGNKLFHSLLLANPSMYFIVDRKELQEQLYNEYNALDIAPKPEKTEGITGLEQILIHDEGKGKRGVFISLIQKFRPEEFKQLQRELQAASRSQETILTRKNVIVFVDEGHRSQYGTLAGQMHGILKNASFFAFTGTPISKPKRNTYAEFSYPPEDPYLDEYFMKESIIDGFTVKIVYQPRLEKDKDVPMPTEMLNAFFELEIDEVPEELREEVKERTKQKFDIIAFFENPERIRKITQDIAKHFRENVDGKFKAMIVAASRKACVIYKRQLDQVLPKQFTEVVMTLDRSDKAPELQEYGKELTARFKGKEDEDIRKEIIEKYKDEDYPKILIVTEMLLTGFDAPILQTMYLDKPLREHRLLQAVARTNRPYKGLKEAGVIIDYAGILRNFIKAFENYTKKDIEDVLVNLDELKQQFNQTLTETLQLFEGIPKNQYDRVTMRKAIETITLSQQSTETFQENVRKLRRIFEVLGSDPTKLERLEEYKWLTAVYTCYLKEADPNQPVIEGYAQKYFSKTLKYVYGSIEIEKIQKGLPTIAFDENYLEDLEKKLKSKEEKAANIFFTLNRFMLVQKQRDPIYESLVDRVERLLKLWRERIKDYERIYTEGVRIVQDLNELKERKRRLNFSNLQYGVLLTLEKQLGANEDLVQDSKELEGSLKPLMFKDWYIQSTARKTVEREVRKRIRKYIKQYGLNLKQYNELCQGIMENVKTHGQEI
jgi:type I restriction enzyme R subunit